MLLVSHELARDNLLVGDVKGLWSQLAFDFGVREIAPERRGYFCRVCKRKLNGDDRVKNGACQKCRAAPSTPKVYTCLRCEQPNKNLTKEVRICRDCKHPTGKAKRKAWYVDRVELYSVSLRSRGGPTS